MVKTLREIIKNTVYHHLKKKNGLVFGQCLTAVGWVGGTLPHLKEKDGMIDLSMADVANGGIVAGAGLSGRRPIYVIRYQGFNWFNAPIILNYSCKSKEIWGIPCPIFVRGIAMEGSIGPVAGSSHTSLYYRMPGIKILSPMTPNEYKLSYNFFMKNDDVVYVSEHRGSYDNKIELKDIYQKKCDLVIFAISITRFEAIKAVKELKKEGINVGLANILWIKPFKIKNKWIEMLNNSKYGGIILDDDYTKGIAESLAFKLLEKTKKNVHLKAIGLKDKSAGFSKKTDNLPPSKNELIKIVREIIKKK